MLAESTQACFGEHVERWIAQITARVGGGDGCAGAGNVNAADGAAVAPLQLVWILRVGGGIDIRRKLLGRGAAWPEAQRDVVLIGAAGCDGAIESGPIRRCA